MDIKEIKILKFIDGEFRRMLEPCGGDYHKLIERVLQARFNVLNFLSKEAPPETCDEENNSVDHPLHYTSHPSNIECIEVARHYCFSIGNAIKYLWRAGLKKEMGLEDKEKEIEDLKKAIWYINDRIKQLSNED